MQTYTVLAGFFSAGRTCLLQKTPPGYHHCFDQMRGQQWGKKR